MSRLPRKAGRRENPDTGFHKVRVGQIPLLIAPSGHPGIHLSANQGGTYADKACESPLKTNAFFPSGDLPFR